MKNTRQNQLMEGYFTGHLIVRHDREAVGMGAQVTVRKQQLMLVPSSPFYESGSAAHGMVLPTFNSPSPDDTLQTCPQTCLQGDLRPCHIDNQYKHHC